MTRITPLEFSFYAQRAAHADAGLQALAQVLAAALPALDHQHTKAALLARLALLAMPDVANCARALRQLRRELFLALMEFDLASQNDAAALAVVTRSMSAFAEIALEQGLATLMREAADEGFGTPRDAHGNPLQLHIVGMGKLGGRELNVSSDSDLIFLYADDGETDGAHTRTISAQDFFTKIGQRLIRLLNDATEDGYVFRVDMRLRPNGDAGPLVASFAMLEEYFIVQGREWERYAWIKGRTLTGDRDAELAQIVKPFVYRRYLDYGAIDALRGLHATIRREVARRDLADHIKLGPGGIREIEFIAQCFQLIRGGRDVALQIMPTTQVLALVGERSQLDADAVTELSAAYVFLRQLEHRLQYVDDQQTHELPRADDHAAHARLAAAMGCADAHALRAKLDGHRHAVTRHFDAVFAPTNVESSADYPEQDKPLDFTAYADPTEAQRRLTAMQTGARVRSLAATAKARLDALLPRVVAACAIEAAPDQAFIRTLDLLETIAPRSAYLALLNAHPRALQSLVRLLGSSAWAAHYLTRHAVLLDELIDPRSLAAAPDVAQFAETVRDGLRHAQGDLETQLNVAREAHHAYVFRLLAQDIAGQFSVEQLADHLSAAADALVECVLHQLWHELAPEAPATPPFAVLAYGKWGGKELGYASDLDWVFVYDDEDGAFRYARLAQKLTSFFETRTLAGILYETDARLRPDGQSGPMVTSFAALEAYQHERAWLWEHQALTRARFAAGEPKLGARFEALRRAVLQQSRAPDPLRTEIVAMREKMHAGHPNRSALFDLKHDRGGMVDIEFIVQYLVLRYAATHPTLSDNAGNIALLYRAGQRGLIDPALAAQCATVYRAFRQAQHAFRLNASDTSAPARVPTTEALAKQRQAVERLWAYVFGHGA